LSLHISCSHWFSKPGGGIGPGLQVYLIFWAGCANPAKVSLSVLNGDEHPASFVSISAELANLQPNHCPEIGTPGLLENPDSIGLDLDCLLDESLRKTLPPSSQASTYLSLIPLVFFALHQQTLERVSLSQSSAAIF
jgi:hypothetical protein